MNSSPTSGNVRYVGLDVHAETIAVAIAESKGEVRSYGNIPAHSHSIDRLHKKLGEGGAKLCYVYDQLRDAAGASATTAFGGASG